MMALSAVPPSEFFARLQDLLWMRFSETIDYDLNDKSGFSPALLELVELLKYVVLRQRGPGILGYFSRLELSFSPRADASYDPQNRVLRFNLGFALYINELEATCQWLESVLRRGSKEAVSIPELASSEVPPAVHDELAALFHAGATGELAVSGHNGLAHPVAAVMLRFVLAHELGHLIDAAESPKLHQSWEETAWADYQDALDFGLASGWLNPERWAGLQRRALPETVAAQWGAEFIADGLGFYTALQAAQERPSERQLAYAYLQTAVELFFHSLVLVYRGDVGEETHPPPTLRATVVRARRRKDHRVDWPQFLTGYWAPGSVVSALLDAAVRGFRRAPIQT